MGAPDRPDFGASGAPTLTRFASLTTLSRQAGEGLSGLGKSVYRPNNIAKREVRSFTINAGG